MIRGSLALGSVSGIKLYVHWTFLILVGWVTFNSLRAGADTLGTLLMIGILLIVFACVLLHELGHALAAKRYGIHTTDITLLPIGGLANLERIPEDPKQEFVVAIAGPAVNVVIGFFLLGLAYVTGGPFTMDQVLMREEAGVILTLASINLWLVVFNLIPAFPMDGGRVLRALLAMTINRVKATKIAARIGQICAVGFGIYGITDGQPFLVLIALFVFFGAGMESRAVESNAYLEGYKVLNAMRTRFSVLQVTDSLARAVQELLAGGDKDFVVMDGEHFSGLLTRGAIMKAIYEKQFEVYVGTLADRDVYAVSPDEPLKEAHNVLSASKQGFLPVIDHGKLVGVVDAENILEFMMIKQASAGIRQ